ncbi:hypothetical protein DP939_12065 [Spongiactinospora rosea]|uniref:Uncharacterized protein n=1 Tax=Spongiactinospora rosea TaxID=2248750 RepID=A0A366M1N1_9ACTN|nr:hypothetical protein [Spongiactinospora rosea]RBQ19494.1 hypothetical protein DP939_12065 [Spongiactinospora rosea]
MMDTLSCLERFAGATRRHADLSVQSIALNSDPAYVCVRNRFSSTLFETVTCSDGAFVTSWGYRLGDMDDVDAAADRLAFLLAALPA